MARTQAADYEERREAIVERAAELFARRGFQGTSVSDLAAACNTSKSLLYHYYPSKEDVLHAVMASHIEALGEAADAVERAGGGAEARLADLVHRFMGLYAGAAARHKVLLNELDNLPAARRTEIVAQQRRLIAQVETLLAGLHPPLKADAARRRAAAMLLFGMINWTHTWFRPDGGVSADALADMVLDIVRGGLPALQTSSTVAVSCAGA